MRSRQRLRNSAEVRKSKRILLPYLRTSALFLWISGAAEARGFIDLVRLARKSEGAAAQYIGRRVIAAAPDDPIVLIVSFVFVRTPLIGFELARSPLPDVARHI